MVKPIRKVFGDGQQWAKLMWQWALNLHNKKRDLDKNAKVCSHVTVNKITDELLNGEPEESNIRQQSEETLKKIEATSKNNFKQGNFF